MSKTVTYVSENNVATITLNRPAHLNALDNSMVYGLHDAWQRFEAGTDRVAVLTASGDRAFCAGVDVKTPPDEMWLAVPGVGVRLTKPVIASVFGHCVGGGYVISQHCDLVVASEGTVFRYPEAVVGVSGGLGSASVARMAPKRAMEFILLGEPVDATWALEAGMVNRVVPAGEERHVAHAMAEQVAQRAPLVVSLLKRFADETIPTSPAEAHAYARRDLLAIRMSSDRQEGALAARERRAPLFTGQ